MFLKHPKKCRRAVASCGAFQLNLFAEKPTAKRPSKNIYKKKKKKSDREKMNMKYSLMKSFRG